MPDDTDADTDTEDRLNRADDLSLPQDRPVAKRFDPKWYWIGGGIVVVILLALAVKYFTGNTTTTASTSGTTPGGGAAGSASGASSAGTLSPGAVGATGATGAPGPMGLQGPQGLPGPVGAPAPKLVPNPPSAPGQGIPVNEPAFQTAAVPSLQTTEGTLSGIHPTGQSSGVLGLNATAASPQSGNVLTGGSVIVVAAPKGSPGAVTVKTPQGPVAANSLSIVQNPTTGQDAIDLKQSSIGSGMPLNGVNKAPHNKTKTGAAAQVRYGAGKDYFSTIQG